MIHRSGAVAYWRLSSMRKTRLPRSRRAAASSVETRSQFAVRCLMPCAPGCCGLLDFDRDRQRLPSGFTVIPARFAEQQCRNDRGRANCRHNRENSEKTKHISCSQDNEIYLARIAFEGLLEASSFMIDLGGGDVIHHREKLVGDLSLIHI